MDVVNKIAQGDTTMTVTIVRAGTDAENFIVNDEIFMKLVQKQWNKVNSEHEAKKISDEKFIADTYPDLTTLPDGLRYKIVVKGSGNPPAEGSETRLSYTGRLINGLKFSSSAEGKPVASAKPAAFSCKPGSEQLIKGLQESIMEMKEGEKRLLVVPPELGYGVNGVYYGKEMAGQKRFVISPGEILILEVTVNKIYPPVR
jgi:FKBP-type peptidyl-prolyl cis-trans isomerase